MGGVFWSHSPSSGPQIHSQRWPLVPPPLHTWGQRARSSLTSTSIGWDLKEKKDKEGQTHTSQELGFLEVVRESGSGTRRVPVSPFPLCTQTSPVTTQCSSWLRDCHLTGPRVGASHTLEASSLLLDAAPGGQELTLDLCPLHPSCLLAHSCPFLRS